jgi:hypothetical protein
MKSLIAEKYRDISTNLSNGTCISDLRLSQFVSPFSVIIPCFAEDLSSDAGLIWMRDRHVILCLVIGNI